MERSVAIKKLGKMLGKSLGYRVDPRAPSAEERKAAAAQAKTLAAECMAAELAESARRTAILEADAEYQRLKIETKRLRDAKNTAWGTAQRFKITVGTSSSLFFHVKAQGDSWEDVIAILSK